MATMRSAFRDNLVAGVLLVVLVILSFTTIATMRNSNLVRECVLPEGSLCKGNPDYTQRLLDELVRRVNEHTDAVHGVK